MVLRVCCLEVSVPTHWGRRTLRSTGLCGPGCLDWARRLSTWMWAGRSSTLMETSSHRTCLTSSTWRHQVTEASLNPSVTCCFRYWRRHRRRDGHRWYEGRGSSFVQRHVSPTALGRRGGHVPGICRRKGSVIGGRGILMWLSPQRSWNQIHEWRVGCGEVLKRERDVITDRHCDCSSKL